MRRFPTFLAAFFAIALMAFWSVPVAAENAYAGVDACKMCHKKEDKGNQYEQWQGSKHANAYATLASDKAKEIASGKGIANAQEAAECLECHVTAAGVDASLLDKEYNVEDGVGCESCHGAGSEYKYIKIMKDEAAAVAAGLMIPNEDTCKKCHNEESPTFKEFDFAARSAEIAHPTPNK